MENFQGQNELLIFHLIFGQEQFLEMITNAIITGLILSRFAAIPFHVIFGMPAVAAACRNVGITGFSENKICDNFLHSAPKTINLRLSKWG